jgi:adenylate kinase family enzyme
MSTNAFAEITGPPARRAAAAPRDGRIGPVALPGRIHILGASGAGTTSLATALATRYAHRHLDTDDFFWVRTDPPYREKRPRAERLVLLRQALGGSSAWVLSGSLCGWGDPLIPEFELVVFLVVPTPVRLARLRAREAGRYSPCAIRPGGALPGAHEPFLDWAGRYDTGGLEMRSRARHEAWLATLPCRVIRLEGELPVAEQLSRIRAELAAAF